MAMTFCPECHAKISDKAMTCPYCGFSSDKDGKLIPISSLPPVSKAIEVLAPGSEVFDDGTSLIPYGTREKLSALFKSAEEVARLAPSVYDAIQQALAKRGTIWAADFTAAAEKMMDSGELVLGVEKKTGALLPQLRSVETGQTYEQARLHVEQLPDNLASSIATVQLQLSMAQLLSEIKDVAYGVERLHLEERADRIGRAKAVWYQLQQAAHIRDARLREQRILSIAGSATEQRSALQDNFETELSLAIGKGKAKALGSAAREAIIDLSIISLMARTEYAAYSLVDEPDAAMTALSQFGEFMSSNRLDEKETLIKLNSISDNNLDNATTGFYQIAKNVNRALNQSAQDETKRLSQTEEEG